MVISEFQVLKSEFFLVSNALTVYTHCWSACEYSVLVWFLFVHYAPDVKNMDISLHTDTQHRAVSISSLYENLSTTQNLP